MKKNFHKNLRESNKRSVTIETANSTMAPTWELSDESLYTLIKLLADIAKGNNFGTIVKGVNVIWHNMHAVTACPGPYVSAQMDYIVTEANKLI